MRRSWKFFVGMTALMGLGWMGIGFSPPATAGGMIYGSGFPPYASPYYSSPYYYPSPVVVQPLVLPRIGSNDYLYYSDNVYGLGASAAGRMDRVVVNPQPQLFYPRQPRVFFGY